MKMGKNEATNKKRKGNVDAEEGVASIRATREWV